MPVPQDVAAIRVGRRGREQLVIECPFCHEPHYHDVVGPHIGDGDGHRVSHCRAKERHSGAERGYVLREVSAAHCALDVRVENEAATR